MNQTAPSQHFNDILRSNICNGNSAEESSASFPTPGPLNPSAVGREAFTNVPGDVSAQLPPSWKKIFNGTQGNAVAKTKESDEPKGKGHMASVNGVGTVVLEYRNYQQEERPSVLPTKISGGPMSNNITRPGVDDSKQNVPTPATSTDDVAPDRRFDVFEPSPFHPAGTNGRSDVNLFDPTSIGTRFVITDEDPFALFGDLGQKDNPLGQNSTDSFKQDRKAPSSSPRSEDADLKCFCKGMPSDGDFFQVSVPGATSGIIVFLKPQELVNSLLSESKKSFIEALCDRPVVSFLAEKGGFRKAGVKLGHVLLAVNGNEVRTPSEAQHLITKEGRGPHTFSFYVPKVSVACTEGYYRVKYDERTSLAPVRSSHWKAKYVVVGGLIADKLQICMYRSRAEYELAVKETFDGRRVSVKVKKFYLHQGSYIHHNNVKTVRYDYRSNEWTFFVVKFPGSNSLKIASSKSDENLEPILERVRHLHAEQACKREQQNAS